MRILTKETVLAVKSAFVLYAVTIIFILFLVGCNSWYEPQIRWRARDVETGITRIIKQENGFQIGDTINYYQPVRDGRYVLVSPIDTIN